MVKQGLVDEVKKIYKKYPDKNLVSLSGIGYKEIISYLDKKITLEQATERVQQNTRNYAKRQMTWFRRIEKKGAKIYWNKKIDIIAKMVKKFITS